LKSTKKRRRYQLCNKLIRVTKQHATP
jgi:hypothetical protein